MGERQHAPHQHDEGTLATHTCAIRSRLRRCAGSRDYAEGLALPPDATFSGDAPPTTGALVQRRRSARRRTADGSSAGRERSRRWLRLEILARRPCASRESPHVGSICAPTVAGRLERDERRAEEELRTSDSAARRADREGRSSSSADPSRGSRSGEELPAGRGRSRGRWVRASETTPPVRPIRTYPVDRVRTYQSVVSHVYCGPAGRSRLTTGRPRLGWRGPRATDRVDEPAKSSMSSRGARRSHPLERLHGADSESIPQRVGGSHSAPRAAVGGGMSTVSRGNETAQHDVRERLTSIRAAVSRLLVLRARFVTSVRREEASRVEQVAAKVETSTARRTVGAAVRRW